MFTDISDARIIRAGGNAVKQATHSCQHQLPRGMLMSK